MRIDFALLPWHSGGMPATTQKNKRTPADGFDPCAIDFPTDAITFGRMRRTHVRIFDKQYPNPDIIANEVVAMHYVELSLARDAYNRAAGLPTKERYSTQEEEIEALDDFYTRFGLSNGMHGTREAVRAFETAASQQVKRQR